ncbi:DUF4198 domain-containing protein [Pseudomonas sp. F1_0610]|uniref:DUF4198 domain-containing protein n=1 Tax=Pseudomonas sp. F1_0610 TaxID=3114284 RepID=UPI0039C0166D
MKAKSLKWAALALAMTLPLSAQAHRVWMLPSATVLSGDDAWVTVDAAVANELFYFDHFPLQLEGIGEPLVIPNKDGKLPEAKAPARKRAELQIFTPDNQTAKAWYGNTGRYRTTFDVQLNQKGTWKIGISGNSLFASFEENGEKKRWSGSLEEFKTAIPKGVSKLQVTQYNGRTETYVTAGNPTDKVFTPSKQGLELVPVTHPNDLVANEASTFGFLLDGKPAKNVKVTIIPDGNRYRDQPEEIELTTDAKGQITVNWPHAGMYWLGANYSSDFKAAGNPATKRSASYSLTLEVQAP